FRRGSLSHFSPSFCPTYARPRHHGNEPAKVYMMNFFKFIRATPAGNAMNVRIAGSKRLTKTITSPNLSNQRSAKSKSWFETRMYLPYFSINGRPPYIPIQYATKEPTTQPNAPATLTSQMLKRPV